MKRSQRRSVVNALKEKGISQRKACSLVGISHQGFLYKTKENPLNDELRKKPKELSFKHRRWGCPTMYLHLKNSGYSINPKRIHRLYCEENLRLKKRKRCTKSRTERHPLTVPDRPLKRLSMDFIHDTTASGGSFRCLNVVDDCTRECLGIEANKSLSGNRVIRHLEFLILVHGKPESILSDNGPEFTSKVLSIWARKQGIRLEYIEPGKPQQNAFVESFNSLMRDQCLNENWFLDLDDAREKIEEWRVEYNTIRPHGSLGMTPAKYGAILRKDYHLR